MFGAKFKMVPGYPGGNDINLAMERGETQGRCSIPWSTVKATRRFWIDENKVNLLMQYSLSKHPDLPNVPLVMDLAKNDEQRDDPEADLRSAGDGPSVRGAARRAEGSRRMRCARPSRTRWPTRTFLAEAEKAKFEITPVSGEKIESLVQRSTRNTTPELAEKAGAAMK